MKPNMAVIVGIGKPKEKPGSPPPLPKREEETEKPMRGMSGMGGMRRASGMGQSGMQSDMAMHEQTEPQPEQPVAQPTGIGAIAEKYGMDEATGTAFIREVLETLLPKGEGGEFPPAA